MCWRWMRPISSASRRSASASAVRLPWSARPLAEPHLTVSDSHFGNTPVDMPLSCCLASRRACTAVWLVKRSRAMPSTLRALLWKTPCSGCCSHPAVASKSFLITIGDRSITGLVARDQMVGPWQVPVADCAVTTSLRCLHRRGHGHGRAHPAGPAGCGPASGRMAVGEPSPTWPLRHRQALRHQAVGQLDGCRRPPGRGCTPVRHRQGGRHGAVPRSWASAFRWARTRCR
jgi:hypothetical protein